MVIHKTNTQHHVLKGRTVFQSSVVVGCVLTLCVCPELICTALQAETELSDQESIILYDLIVLQHRIDFSQRRC